jgi:hypothetical protein
LPELGVGAIKAKIDTGARSSALHASLLETYRVRRRDFAKFIIHPVQRQHYPEVAAEAEIVEYRSVRSSNGVSEQRPVIVTPVAWNGKVWEIELTLARRDEMGFRCLLGRQAVRDRVLVDAGHSYYGGAKPGPAKRRRGKTRS